MEIQTVKTKYIVPVRIRKRDYQNGNYWAMVDNAVKRGGTPPSGFASPLYVDDWSNRHKVVFTFTEKRQADRFAAWLRARNV